MVFEAIQVNNKINGMVFEAIQVNNKINGMVFEAIQVNNKNLIMEWCLKRFK